ILAPKSVYSNWSRQDEDNPGELQKWMWKEVWDEGYRCHQYRAGKLKADTIVRNAVMDPRAPGPRVLVLHVEALSATDEAVRVATEFLKAHKTMMVIDESTIIKDPMSKRTKLCLRLRDYAERRRILTGSPTTGSPSDVWAQF